MTTLLLLLAAQDFGRLVEDLGRDDVTAKGEAWKALDAAGEAALPALQKALYHEEPEIRVQAREILRSVRKRLALRPVLDPIRAAVAKVRARWIARDFDDLDAVVRECFRPAPLYVHYAPRREIGHRFESASGGPAGAGFAPLQAGGARDVLPREAVGALTTGEGLIFLDARFSRVDVSDVLIFTLPDRAGGWTAYLVVKLAGVAAAALKFTYAADAYKSRLLASADSRSVWGLDPAEIEWAEANVEEILTRHLTLEPAAGGGLRVLTVASSGLAASRGVMAGDLVRDINSQAMNSIDDLRKLLTSLAGQTGLRITVERDGRPVVLEYRPFPR